MSMSTECVLLIIWKSIFFLFLCCSTLCTNWHFELPLLQLNKYTAVNICSLEKTKKNVWNKSCAADCEIFRWKPEYGPFGCAWLQFGQVWLVANLHIGDVKRCWEEAVLSCSTVALGHHVLLVLSFALVKWVQYHFILFSKKNFLSFSLFCVRNK